MAGDEADPWEDRVLCALDVLTALHVAADQQALREAVGARFASRFDEQARLYAGERPHWHQRVDEAVERLVTQRLVTRQREKATPTDATGPTLRLTPAGHDAVKQACERALAVDRGRLTGSTAAVDRRDPVLAGVLTRPLRERFPPESDPQSQSRTLPVMVELNLRFGAGAGPARQRVAELWRLVGATDAPEPMGDEYVVGDLTADQLEGLVSADAAGGDWPNRAIYRIWPDFEAKPQIDATGTTIKARAAQRTFESFGDGIVWAVVDSGIDQTHPHFHGYATLTDTSVADLHRDFTTDSDDPQLALVDHDGHGTHVAGIIAGGLQQWDDPDRRVIAVEKRVNNASLEGGFPIIQPREVADINRLAGMAPRAKLVSLKVLGQGDRATRVSRVMRALVYVRQKNAESQRLPRIHGVNLSLGYDFSAEWYACGQSPLCAEVDKLVNSGVVVVAAAGNSGYVTLNPKFADVTNFSAAVTINDPGNAQHAITVGSTHRDSPHTFGISYFSSRGPTGDGRAKPDLVAPGERITSAAAGENLAAVQAAKLPGLAGAAVYIEDSGTSMAAPHVSGAIAAFLSVQRELIGKPEDIKRIFVESATSLGREPAFQGSGLVDLLRALQSV